MRAGGPPGRSDLADDLADAHRLPDLHVDLRQMPVAGGQPVAVVDLDQIAVPAVAAGNGDAAIGGRVHRLTDLAAQVDAGVHGRAAEEGIGAYAERRGHVEFAGHRLAHRNAEPRLRERIGPGPSDNYLVELG